MFELRGLSAFGEVGPLRGLSGKTEAGEVALWLTMLPCDASRGRFGDSWRSMTVSFGSEAEGAARASAGGSHIRGTRSHPHSHITEPLAESTYQARAL
eukprot:scaffold17550_cov119-Isochrysis_galbana.AAC.2